MPLFLDFATASRSSHFLMAKISVGEKFSMVVVPLLIVTRFGARFMQSITDS